MNDFITSLIAFAAALAALAAFDVARRAAARSRPRLTLSKFEVGPAGLDVTLRNEASSAALGISLMIDGDFDGGRRHVLHDLGGGHALVLAAVAPAGDRFDVALLYEDDARCAYELALELRQGAGGPLRIVAVREQTRRITFRAWLRAFSAR